MLQRYDISMDTEANNLSIEEFAVLGQINKKQEYFDPTRAKYSSLHKAIYEGDIIRGAIKRGREALISEIRSDHFFPIRSCAELIAEKVIELFGIKTGSSIELFFDDRSLFIKEEESAGS
ncbi:hypothetical protein ACFL0O_00875 [Thermodesulfobacteriota bacterium]